MLNVNLSPPFELQSQTYTPTMRRKTGPAYFEGTNHRHLSQLSLGCTNQDGLLPLFYTTSECFLKFPGSARSLGTSRMLLRTGLIPRNCATPSATTQLVGSHRQVRSCRNYTYFRRAVLVYSQMKPTPRAPKRTQTVFG